VVRKKIKKTKVAWRGLAAAGLVLPALIYRPFRNFIFDGVTNFFTQSHLYDRYDRKWIFRAKPNLTLIMFSIDPTRFQSSEEMQNLSWGYCWALFLKKYTQLEPVLILNIPSNVKAADLEQVKDTVSTLHEQLLALYRDPELRQLQNVEIVFENDSSFRKTKKIGDGIQLLVIDKKQRSHTLPLTSIMELHSPIAMSFISDYTGIGTTILDEILTKKAAALKMKDGND
jgi:hypothetical protein